MDIRLIGNKPGQSQKRFPQTKFPAMSPRDRLEVALQQIEYARKYTHSLLADVTDNEWFHCPPGAQTHIAWQVGHLAMAEYGLCLFRVRGRQPIDTELMSSRFRKKFSRGSTPELAREDNPTADELRDVLRRVHEQVCEELAPLVDDDLGDPIDEPYSVEATKLGGLYFCAAHEMLHAGQIGLLRRLLGKEPIR
jgi:hypothetical protein